MRDYCVAYGCNNALAPNKERYENDGNYCKTCIAKANRAKVEKHETLFQRYASERSDN
jgi:hypothetical protein